MGRASAACSAAPSERTTTSSERRFVGHDTRRNHKHAPTSTDATWTRPPKKRSNLMYQEEIPFLRRRRNFLRGGLSEGHFTVKSRSDLAVQYILYAGPRLYSCCQHHTQYQVGAGLLSSPVCGSERLWFVLPSTRHATAGHNRNVSPVARQEVGSWKLKLVAGSGSDEVRASYMFWGK